ncbi:hypothetical protein [Streptomyces sp. CMB-StM0423]|uniref:hypothetical protein n=1 Tax=Streptomyces sp. CMB-StM0423 TaxID=2059884 RepID=UPI000C6FE48D|nr:hypothetical protein [Streptomyces sp. CMB-StM0423]AUH42728.1 hypothetical protein CXR04_23375 [Streptomyces sp. CMB-StM0423]
MRGRARRAGGATTAAALAAALTAGLIGPAGARPPPSAAAGEPVQVTRGPSGWVTLPTGDRVRAVRGDRVLIERGPGREGMPMRTYESEGHTYVVMRDAEKLIADGTVDRQLFDVTLRSRPEYLRHERDGIELIVGYRGRRPTARAELHGVKGTEVGRGFPAINAEAVTTPHAEAGAAWRALTREADGPGGAGGGAGAGGRDRPEVAGGVGLRGRRRAVDGTGR